MSDLPYLLLVGESYGIAPKLNNRTNDKDSKGKKQSAKWPDFYNILVIFVHNILVNVN